MRDIWRLSGIAVVFIVLLRLAIGWQFVYEGLWKHETLSSAKPWTAAGYLRNAHGPFRNVYRQMTGDPDDMRWLDYDAVAAQLDGYRDRFIAHYRDLSEVQKAKLSEMLDGPEQFVVKLARLPASVKLKGPLEKVVTYDPEEKLLIVSGKLHVLPKEKLELEKQVQGDQSPDAQRFRSAVNQVYRQASKLSFKERLQVLLKIDPERVGQVYRDDKTKDILEERKGKIAQYTQRLTQYEQALPQAHEDFERQHLVTQWEEIQKLRADLVNPVRALVSEYQDDARKLLDINQLAQGPVPEPWTPQRRIDRATVWALIALGGLLMVGLFSRLAAIGAAVLLLSFYLAVPPWPGVIELVETAGPEHSFLINKNLIEVLALLGIACMPTGQWFGLDRLLWGSLRARHAGSLSPPPSVMQPSASKAPSAVVHK